MIDPTAGMTLPPGAPMPNAMPPAPMPPPGAPGSLPPQQPPQGGFLLPDVQGISPGGLAPPPPRPPELDLLEKLAAMPNAAIRLTEQEDGSGNENEEGHGEEEDEALNYDGEEDEDTGLQETGPTGELISQKLLNQLSRQVADGYERDKASRADWEEQAERAMETAKQKRKSKDYPFPNAANVQYPLITIAAQQFNARAYPAICTGQNIVRARIAGNDPDGTKASRGMRVQQYMSHQIVDGMQGGWEHDMDVLLYQLPIIGSAFKKSYWDATLATSWTVTISAFDLIVHADTKDLRSCPRITHRFPLYPYEVEDRIREGTFLGLDLAAIGDNSDDQAPIWFIEQHCYFDLDGDGYAEPWIVTQTEDGAELARLVAGFDPLDIIHDGEQIVRIPREDYFSHFYFLPDPEGGFYGIGFGNLLRSFGEVIDTSFNQMLDAGNLANAGGGFIGEGLDFQSEAEEFRFEPGKYHTVNVEGGDIRGNIYNMDFKGPSPVLFQLLGQMMESAKQITSVQDILTGSAAAQTMQPTTLMALIDQGMKVFTAIYKRIYDGLSAEFRLLYRLNRKYLQDAAYQAFLGIQGASVQADFADDGCLVVPVADPNSVTMAQRMTKASFLKQLLEDPILGKMLDAKDILMRILAAGDIEDIPSALAKPAPPTPADTVQYQTALAQIDNLKAQAAHNNALAEAEEARGEHFQAKTADLIMGHQPQYFQNPPVNK